MLEVASQSQALVLMGDFSQSDIYWEDHTARHKQSRRFLQCIYDNLLTQVVEKPTRSCVMLLTNEEGLVRDVRVRGHLDCNDHDMVEFRDL